MEVEIVGAAGAAGGLYSGKMFEFWHGIAVRLKLGRTKRKSSCWYV
jgi:hypothetical protein